jgi:hypothetical protein
LTIPLCSELNGKICSSGQICGNSKTQTARDGTCCLTSCVEKEKSYTFRIIGWGIIILILLMVGWFYFKKYRKIRNVVNLLKPKQR